MDWGICSSSDVGAISFDGAFPVLDEFDRACSGNVADLLCTSTTTVDGLAAGLAVICRLILLADCGTEESSMSSEGGRREEGCCTLVAVLNE